MIKVSIIVPVYNVEKYLTECLESLVNQTLKDIEIICINDGSTDNSLEILNAYAQKDRRIKVINQENQGVSVARNNGIAATQGEYIMFVDGDDYLRSDACEIAYNSITKELSDVCIFGHSLLVNNNTLLEAGEVKDIRKLIQEQMEPNLFNFAYLCWDKIYKTSFIKNFNLKFIKNLQTAEDTIFITSVFLLKPKCCFCNECLYIYRTTRSGSLTTNNIKGVDSNLRSFKAFYQTELFQQQSINTQLKVVELFLAGSKFYYRKFKTLKEQWIIAQSIDEILRFLETIYSKKHLKTLKSYRQMKLRRFIAILNFIFSIENSYDKKYKIITILGFHFQFSRSKK